MFTILVQILILIYKNKVGSADSNMFVKMRIKNCFGIKNGCFAAILNVTNQFYSLAQTKTLKV